MIPRCLNQLRELFLMMREEFGKHGKLFVQPKVMTTLKSREVLWLSRLHVHPLPEQLINYSDQSSSLGRDASVIIQGFE